MKLAIAGTGLIVNEVLPFLEGWDWEVAAICSTPRSAGKAETLAAMCKNAAVFTDFSRMLAETSAEAVYIGTPNSTHRSMAEAALLAGKHVIVEKPLAVNLEEAERIADLAMKNELFLYEAITTLYQPDYEALRAQLHRIGKIKLVNCNFSQFSSRYEAFERGETAPVFDPKQAGGALMDLNLYNIHWVLGLFGAPEDVVYHANMDRGIDTSGVLWMQYPDFQVISAAAKDSGSPSRCIVQGTKGYLLQNTTANICGEVTLHLNDGTEETYHTETQHRMEMEFRAFRQQMQERDYEACYRALARSLEVSSVLTAARRPAGIRFPSDPD
ncbi:MAG: Gfo/Idh/MocA family oxidoreductase [Oscillospiraceae bacterium]|nr:Gfo/Idh/MocA family oxidoreductase [Oscillospiraceae bacterium]